MYYSGDILARHYSDEDLLHALEKLANLPGSVPKRNKQAEALFNRRWPGFFLFDQAIKSRKEHNTPLDVDADLVWRRNSLRVVWHGGPSAGLELRDLMDFALESFLPNPHSGEIRYLPETPFQAACHLLLKKFKFAKYCANPKCQNPYFIADRLNRLYCSVECLKPIQRAAKRAWWEKEGKKRRQKKAKKAKRKK